MAERRISILSQPTTLGYMNFVATKKAASGILQGFLTRGIIVKKFAHLHVHSCFSFQDGASGVDKLVKRRKARYGRYGYYGS